ncbi:hypothetical protein J2S94_003590 [Arthrobacter bambusae]|nr:hypothetical protein [Arthrobacter bambusae]MDQ0241488.1 hypothetical protein [Arthrobacter bambusae]
MLVEVLTLRGYHTEDQADWVLHHNVVVDAFRVEATSVRPRAQEGMTPNLDSAGIC